MDIFGEAKKELLRRQTESSFEKGNYREALDGYTKMFEILLNSDDSAAIAAIDERIGDCYEKLDHHSHEDRVHDHKKASEHYIKSADRYRKLGNYEKAGLLYEKGAKAYEELGDLKDAADFFKESAKMFSEVRDYINASFAYHKAAEYFEGDGEYERAANTYQESAVFDLRIKDTTNASISFKKSALNFEKAKLLDRAVDSYASSVGIDTLSKQYLDVADTYERMANCYWETNDPEKAIYYHQKSAELRLSNDDKKSAAMNYREIGSIYEHSKNPEKAIEHYIRSAKTFYGANDPVQEGTSYSRAARVYEDMKDYENAGNNFLESAKSNKQGSNDSVAKDMFEKTAESYLKASEGSSGTDKKAAAELSMKAALAYTEVAEFDKSADAYNGYANLMYEAGEKELAIAGYKKAAEEYVKGGRVWDAAEAYVNYEDYKRAAELYDAYSQGKESKKDYYGAALGYREAGNCYLRQRSESLSKSRLDRTVALFNKAIDELKQKETKDSPKDFMNLIGDAYRKNGECYDLLGEMNLAHIFLTKAEEYYTKADDKDRITLAKAYRLKVEAIKAIDYGYYPKAETLLIESQGLFRQAAETGGWKREYMRILVENADQTQEMIDKIKLKPEVVLDIDKRSYTFVNIPVILNVRLSNNGKYTMKEITFLEHLPEEIRLTKLPEKIDSIDPGMLEKTSIELTPTKIGFYRLKPLEVYYEDQKAHKYVKASSEMSLEIVESPPTDFKNFAKAVEIFQEYAKSQEENENWFQAGDGYRQMAEIYGRFKTDETLLQYQRKSGENYGKYASENEGRKLENKTMAKRLADANWHRAESDNKLGLLDEAIAGYEKSIPRYRQAAMENLALRSMAFKLKTEGTKAVKVGEYEIAEARLAEALKHFDTVVKMGGIDEESIKTVEKNEDDAKKMLQLIREKPDIYLKVTCQESAKTGEKIEFKATVINPQDYPLKALKPAIKAAENMELVEKASIIEEIPAGKKVTIEFSMSANGEGQYKFKPLDLTYQDNKGNTFMKGSNEVTITVSGAPQEQAQAGAQKKTDVTLEIDKRSYTFTELPVIVNLTLSNGANFPLRNVTYLEHLPGEITVTRLPENIREMGSGTTKKSWIELRPRKTGVYRIKPIELYYEDPGGNRYVKASNEITMEVVEKPASDYKNYAAAVDTYQKYAQSQQNNMNWYQAGDGYRQMAETYGKFKTDETLQQHWKNAVENYRRYLAQDIPDDPTDKTAKKRRGDANWYIGEGLRNMDQYEQSSQALADSARLYEECDMEHLALRSKAMKQKVEAIIAIKTGDYDRAEERIQESLKHFDQATKTSGFESDEMDYIFKNEDETKKLLESIRNKPEINVTANAPKTAVKGRDITIRATITNPLKSKVTQIRPTINVQDGLEITENTRPINELAPGESADITFKMKAAKAGEYVFHPLDVSYKDERGNTFMKGGNTVTINVEERAEAPAAASRHEPKEDTEPTPTINLEFEQPTNPPIGQYIEVKGKLSNDGQTDVQGIRFIGNSKDGLEVEEVPEPVQELAAGKSMEVKARIKMLQRGIYTLSLVQMVYKNPQGKRFFKTSNQMRIDAQAKEETPKPATKEPSKELADMRDKLVKVVRELPDAKVILISAKSENHTYAATTTLDILVGQEGMGGVYIGVTQPYSTTIQNAQTQGIKTENIYFIDCISIMAGKEKQEKKENVQFIENPSSLEEISMYLDKMLSKIKNTKKFIVLDSLSSLLIYNQDKTVKEFTHFLINKVRLEKMTGIILNIEKKEAEDLVKTLAPMCDAEIPV